MNRQKAAKIFIGGMGHEAKCPFCGYIVHVGNPIATCSNCGSSHTGERQLNRTGSVWFTRAAKEAS